MSTHARNALLAALGCAATPLVLGVGIFVAWCATRWPVFQGLGVLNIVMGFILVVISAGALLSFLIWSHAEQRLRFTSTWLLAFLVIGVIALNFGTCAAILHAVSNIDGGNAARDQGQRPRVHILNQTELPFNNVSVTQGPTTGSVAPGTVLTVFLPLDFQGTAVLRGSLDGKPVETSLTVPPHGPNEFLAIIQGDGAIRVHSLEDFFSDRD